MFYWITMFRFMFQPNESSRHQLTRISSLPSCNVTVKYILYYFKRQGAMAQFTNDSMEQIGWNATDFKMRIANDYVKIAYSFTASLGIVGNSMVIFIIARSAMMRKTNTNILILNQCGIDLMASLLILITTMTIKTSEKLTGITGDLYCRFWLSDLPLWSLLTSSSYSLMAITFERYMSIVHPILHHGKFSTKIVLILAGASWCTGFICYICYIVPHSDVVDGRCVFNIHFRSNSHKRASGAMLFIVQYFVPIVCFVFCYGHIFVCLRSRVASATHQTLNAADVQKARWRRNVLKTLVTVVLCYIACNSCNQFTFLAYNFGVNVSFRSYFYHFSVILMFANSCINPFVYAFQFERYQKELRKVFCKRNDQIESVTFS